MTESPHIVQLDETNFVQVVVEGSVNVPVLVDFWADWCGPCKALMPILEKLAIEYDGAFILAKLDTEANPGIAQQLGIRSLPTVKLFKDQQLVDEFMGALPEPEVRAFLDKHVSPVEADEPEGDQIIEIAMQTFEQGDAAGAKTLLEQAQADDPANPQILLALGQVCISTGDLETAESCLQALPEADKEDTAGKRLAAMLSLAQESVDSDIDPAALAQQLESNPADSDARYKLAVHQAMQGELTPALDNLMEIVRTDPEYNEGAARKKLLALFDVMGSDPKVSAYRRKLFALLH